MSDVTNPAPVNQEKSSNTAVLSQADLVLRLQQQLQSLKSQYDKVKNASHDTLLHSPECRRIMEIGRTAFLENLHYSIGGTLVLISQALSPEEPVPVKPGELNATV